LSQALESIEALRESLTNLPDVLVLYNIDEVEVESRIRIKGKTIERANIEQASYYYEYARKRAELAAIVKFMEGQLDSAHGSVWREYTEGFNVDLDWRDKTQYTKSDNRYVKQLSLFLAVKERYDQYDEIVKAFETRGYALNNVTRLKIAEASDYMIT
jgi:hypothetical protein